MEYNLAKYEKAFAMLDVTYQYKIVNQVRQAMVFFALNFDLDDNDNQAAIQTLFGSTSGLLWGDENMLTCLRAIKALGAEGKSSRESAITTLSIAIERGSLSGDLAKAAIELIKAKGGFYSVECNL